MTTLIRRSCYDKVGLYDESLPWEDWDMWMRIARHYSFVYSPIPSAKYRVHPQSYSHVNRPRMLKQSFDIGLKQFNLGGLTENQKSKLMGALLWTAEELYKRKDPHSSDILLALWRATGRARWMYRFSKLGLSYRSWQRANRLRIKMRSFSDPLQKAH